jgi:hypothetical protein
MRMSGDDIGHFFIILGMVEVAVLMLFRTIREPKITFMKMVVVLSCLFLIIWALTVGDVWFPHDYVCHPGQHCFPWG